MEYNVRPAVVEDAPVILDFIKKLALYEKRPDSVTATIDDLIEHIFNNKIAESIIGEYKGKPAGFAVFFHNFSTFQGKPGIYIEDLYIDEAARRKGLGKSMFKYIARIALERGCGTLEWSVLKWNLSSIEFYRKMGAEIKDEWDFYMLNGKSLKILANNKNI